MAAHGGTRRGPGRPAGRALADGETRALLLAAAAGLFQRRGYANVAIGEIAAAVGVTKPTLYYHFGDKDGLYTAVVCLALTTLGERIAALAAAPGPLRDRLIALARALVAEAPPEISLAALLRDVAAQLPPERRAEVAAAHAGVLGALGGLLGGAAARGELRAADPRFLAQLLLQLLDWLLARPDRPPAGDDPAIPAVIDLFLYGAADTGRATQPDQPGG